MRQPGQRTRSWPEPTALFEISHSGDAEASPRGQFMLGQSSVVAVRTD